VSSLGRVGVSPPAPGTQQARETPLDTRGLRVLKLQQKNDADPLRDKRYISGVVDPTRAAGSPLTDGIAFTAGQAIELAHGLGRAAQGFIVTDCQVGAHGLVNDKPNLTKGLEKTHIRLKNTALVTTVVKVQVV
jgi:hypothetical protein